MPYDALTGWTLERLLIELADEVSLSEYGSGANNAAVVPTDPNVRDQLTRAVNRGYASFLRANPRWSFLERVVEITCSPDGSGGECVNGDPGRYLLPSFVLSQPKGDWTFADGIAGLSRVLVRDEISVRRMRDMSPGASGVPAYSAVRPLEALSVGLQGPARREVVFYPAPDRPYVLRAVFRVHSHELVDLHDRHIAGQEHDLAILEQAVWEFRRLDTPTLVQPRTRLDQSIALDYAARPRDAGSLARTFQSGGAERIPHDRVITMNGQPL